MEICFVKSSASQKNRWQLSSFILYRQACPWQESELDLNLLKMLKCDRQNLNMPRFCKGGNGGMLAVLA